MTVIVPVETAILVGVIIAFLLFLKMAISAGVVRSLQFQLAAFLSIWSASEIPRVLDSIGVIDLSSIRFYGTVAHTASMVLFAVFITFRFSKFVLRAAK